MIELAAPPRRTSPRLIAALVVLVAGSARAQCPGTCKAEVAACRRSTCAGRTGAERRNCLAACRGRAGCGKGFGTLAYVVTSCRVVQAGQIGSQELRILRDGCDPVTVVRYANSDPVSDQYVQEAIEQNGRTARVGLTWKFLQAK